MIRVVEGDQLWHSFSFVAEVTKHATQFSPKKKIGVTSIISWRNIDSKTNSHKHLLKIFQLSKEVKH